MKYKRTLIAWVDYGFAHIRAILHPYTIAHAIIAVLVGIGVLFSRTFEYLRAGDKAALQEKNPTAHHEETARRRFVVLLALAGWATAFVVTLVYFGITWGLILYLAVNVFALFWIGRTGPIMQPINSARIIGESLIRRALDEMTLSNSDRKTDPSITTQIVTPSSSLPHTKGYEIAVRIHRLGKPDYVTEHTGELAHKLHRGKSCVFVYTDRNDASLLRIVALDRDPWETPSPPNPLVMRPRRFNLWREAAPIGMRPDNTVFYRKLAQAGDGAGCLLGGAPRMGKTVFLKNILVPMSFDYMCNMHIVDGTAIDFGAFRDIAATFIGDEAMEDIELLRKAQQLVDSLKAEIVRRRKFLLREGHEHLTEEIAMKYGLKHEFFICDELATLTEEIMEQYPKEVKTFRAGIQYIVSKGGKFGVHALLATQRPSDKSIPVVIRDMIIFRIALYIASASGSIAITGKAGRQNRADLLDPKQKGVGIVTGEGQVRSFNIENSDMRRVATAAAAIRAGAPSFRPGVAYALPEPVKTILDIFTRLEINSIKATELYAELTKVTGEPWPVSRVSAALKPYGIAPGTVWVVGLGSEWGYKRNQFEKVPQVEISRLHSSDQQMSPDSGPVVAPDGEILVDDVHWDDTDDLTGPAPDEPKKERSDE